jgi:hypothetical protein
VIALSERLLSKFTRDPETGCWLWKGRVGRGGYGHVWDSGRKRLNLAHRVFYEALVGEIPTGLVLDHECRVRRCVYFGHLYPVTQRENILAGVGVIANNARKVECPRGHAYTETNTRRTKGGRQCRACYVQRYREESVFRASKKALALRGYYRRKARETA